MATTLSIQELLRILPQPKVYSIGDDTEDFIEKMNNYFSIIQLDNNQRKIVVRAYLDDNSREKYDKMPDQEDYSLRLRMAVEGIPDLAKDLEQLLQYKKGEDSAETYIQKVEKGVQRIMKHKLTASKLTSFFLKHCLDSEEERREIQRYEMTEDLLKGKLSKEETKTESDSESRGPTPSKYIKKILQKLDEDKAKIEVAAITKQSYAAITKNGNYNGSPRRQENGNQRKNEIYQERPRRYESTDNRTRYDGLRNTRQEYRSTSNLQCYGCQEHGHIRRECPNIKCSCCGKQGHLSFRCFQRRNENFGRDERSNNQFLKRFDSRRDYRNSKDRVAAMYDDPHEESDAKSNVSGNARAPSSGEMLGAINHM